MKMSFRRGDKKNKVITIVAVAVALLAISLLVAFLLKIGPFAEKVSQASEDTAGGETTVTAPAETDGSDVPIIPDPLLPTLEEGKEDLADHPATGDKLGVLITHKEVRDGKLYIGVLINQVISAGECMLTIENKRFGTSVAVGPQSSTCDGYSIPTSDYSGNSFKLEVRSGDKYGSVEGTING